MKIFINPGHDIRLDSGAVNPIFGLKECDVVLSIGETLQNILLSNNKLNDPPFSEGRIGKKS